MAEIDAQILNVVQKIIVQKLVAVKICLFLMRKISQHQSPE